MKTEIETPDFLMTETPWGIKVYKAITDKAMKIQSKKISFSFTGWFCQNDFRRKHPEFTYKFISWEETGL